MMVYCEGGMDEAGVVRSVHGTCFHFALCCNSKDRSVLSLHFLDKETAETNHDMQSGQQNKTE
jgi:hypothetical protein